MARAAAAVSLPDLLWALPADARELVIGTTFSASSLTTRCRLACKELRDLSSQAVTDVRLRLSASTFAEWQPGQRSVLTRFPACTHLSLHVDGRGDAPRDLPGLALIGLSAASRQRISHVTLTAAYVDVERAIDVLARHLPNLQDLQLHCRDVVMHAAASSSPIPRQIRIFSTIAKSLPRLQHLTLPLRWPGDLTGVAALGAGCPQLRELVILAASKAPSYRGAGNKAEGERLCLRSGSVAALRQLRGLQQLTLSCCDWADSDLKRLPRLMGAQRPPGLRILRFQGPGWYADERAFLVVEFGEGRAPTAAADAAGAGGGAGETERGWGIARVTVDVAPCGLTVMQGLQLVAYMVLAAADSLRQRTIPQLVIQELPLLEGFEGEWDSDAEEGRRGDAEEEWPGGISPLRSLLPRCGRVELQLLPMVVEGCPWLGDPAAAVAAARYLALPACVGLQHGYMELQWGRRGREVREPAAAGESGDVGGGGGAAAAGARPEPAAAVGQRRQQAGRAQRGQRRVPRPQLHLHSATHGQVLDEVVARLWAKAEALRRTGGQQEAGRLGNGAAAGLLEAAAGAAGGSSGGSGSSSRGASGGGRSSAGAALGSRVVLVCGRGLPMPDLHNVDPDDLSWWDPWVVAALTTCFALPQHMTAGLEGAAAASERLRAARSCLEYCGMHVYAPTAGALLLTCGSSPAAARLVALLREAQAARLHQRHSGGSAPCGGASAAASEVTAGAIVEEEEEEQEEEKVQEEEVQEEAAMEQEEAVVEAAVLPGPVVYEHEQEQRSWVPLRGPSASGVFSDAVLEVRAWVLVLRCVADRSGPRGGSGEW